MTSPKVGDRVKVTIEGRLGEVEVLRRFGEIEGATGRYVVPLLVRTDETDATVSVEVIPPPDPATISGDLVIAANGLLWERSTYPDDGWRRVSVNGGPKKVADDVPSRPLTLLVHRGKPVT